MRAPSNASGIKNSSSHMYAKRVFMLTERTDGDQARLPRALREHSVSRT